MATLSSLIVKLKLDAGDYKSELDKAQKATSGFGSALGSLQTAGKLALGAGVAAGAAAIGGMAAVMSSTIPLAAEFQSQVAVLGIAAKDSGLGFDQLHDAALQVGGDSKLVGVSATSAADAMTGLYKAGLTTGEIFGDLQGYMGGTAELGGALRASIDLAAATTLDMVQASDLASVALATFGSELTTEAERADFINAAMNNLVQAADASVAEVGDLAMALKNVGPAASGLGISIEDTNNALALLSTRGITGAEAGTALKSMLTNLQRPTAKVQETMDALGVSLFDATGEFVGLPNLVGQLQTAFSGLTDEERNLAAQTIAGTYGLNALNTLVGEGVAGWDAMAQATGNAAGIQEQASTMANTFAGRMEALQGTVETLKIGIGEAFLPIAQGFVVWLTDIAETYGPTIVNMITRIGGAFQGFFENLQSGMSPIEAIKNLISNLMINVFGSGVEKALAFQDAFDQVREAIGNFLAKVQEVLGPVIQWVQENVKLQDVLIALGVAIAAVIIPALYSILSAIAPVIAIFLVVVATVAIVRKAWETNFLGIQDKTKAVLEFIRNLIDKVVSWISDFWQAHGDQIMEAARTAWEFIKTTIETTINTIKDIVETILNNLRDFWNQHGDEIIKIAEAAWNAIMVYVEYATAQIKTIVEIFQAAFEGDWTLFGEKLRELWDRAWNLILDIIKTIGPLILTAIANIITNIIEKFQSIDWGQVGKDIILGIANGIKNSVAIIKAAAKAAAQAALDAAKGFLGIDSPSKLFMKIGRDTMRGFAVGLSDTSGAEIAMRDLTRALVGTSMQTASAGGPFTVYGDLVIQETGGASDFLQQLRDMQ